MSGVGFEWTIRAGDVLTMGGALVVAFGVLYNRGKTEQTQEDLVTRAVAEIEDLKEEIKKFSQVITRVAVQESQITLLMKWYDELRRGVGYVTERDQRRRSIDGDEYP